MTSRPLPAADERPTLPALTGVRFLAASWVVAFHYLTPWLDANGKAGTWSRLCSQGYVGVVFFFLLSGFVLVYSSQGRSLAGAPARRSFLLARIARIYPLYVLSLLPAMAGLVSDFLQRPWQTELLGQVAREGFLTFSMLQSWHPTTALLWNYPAWSLSAEAFFYLMFPLVVLVLERWEGGLALRAGGALTLVWTALLLHGDLIGLTPVRLSPFYYSPLVHFVTFLSGCLLGRAFCGGVFKPLACWSGRWVDIGLLLGAGAATWVLAVQNPVFSPLQLQMGILAPVFGLMLLMLAQARGFVGGLLGTPVLVALGDASYAMYLLQYPVFSSIRRGLRAMGETRAATSLGMLLLSFALLVSLSLALHRWFEVPFRRWIKARFGRGS